MSRKLQTVNFETSRTTESLEDRCLLTATEWWFDFGTGTSPVAAGYTEVTPGDVFGVTNTEFGWEDGKFIESRDRGPAFGSNDFERDYNLFRKPLPPTVADATFSANLESGTYNVTIISGSVSNTRDFSYEVEGGTTQTLTAALRQFVTQVTTDVAVTDGTLDIQLFPGDSSAALNAVHVELVSLTPGEIHGYKFEDVNGNGVDDGEPRLAGVDIHLDDGINPTVTVATDANGEYWFTGLPSGFDYTVTETPPAGSVQTAGGTTIINLGIGEVLTPVEVPGLAFGNFFEGSIHGYKFEDLNGNGVDDGEPRLAGVEIILDDGVNPPVSTFTNGDGEYWFAPLGPGTYDVTEVPPPGSFQTTLDPAPITLMSGQVVTELDDAGLAFGNFFFGEIHGYKFEDLNVNGVDDNEPRMPGVEIILDDGVNPPISTFTDANGEYWFTGLGPDVYTITENPPPGSFQTTIDPAPITINSSGQVVDEVDVPELAFGNAFEGSIHGYKFDDLNANGVWDNGEPPVEGVQIDLQWLDGQGLTQTLTTFTDPFGEYWFSWLEPGITYNVSEVPPTGSVQSTSTPQPITILSGEEWVATPEQGDAVQRTFHFPWWWDITIDPVDMGQGNPPPEVLGVQGMAAIHLADGFDPNNLTAPPIQTVDPVNGLPVPLPDGQATFQTEIVSLELRGQDGLGRDILVELDPALPSIGQVQTDAQPGQPFLTGDHFFYLGFQITIDDGNDTEVLRLDAPIHVGMTFTDDNMPPVPQQIPRDDVRWMPTFFWYSGLSNVLRDEGGQVWDIVTDIHAVVHDEVNKPVRPRVDPDLAFGNYIPVEIHGLKYDDLNGNGQLDDGEPGVPGVTVTLSGVDGMGGNVNQTATTDENGRYWFTGVKPGTYDVAETVPMGSMASTPINIMLGALESGDVVNDVNFGNYIPVDIHGFKFDDLNGNGVHDMGEPGVPGVTVTVTGTDGMGNAVNIPTMTDPNGDYWVTGLPPGTYSVTETVPEDSVASTPTTHNLGALTSGTVVVAPDFGNYIPVEIHGFKFDDLNGNGVHDAGEPGVPGVTVTLTGVDGMGNVVSETTTTDDDGEYWVTDLAPGTYSVAETVPTGWVASTPTSHDLGALTSGQVVIAPDFGNYVPIEVHGVKFDDLNGNGVRDMGEPGVEGVTISLSGALPNAAAFQGSTTTNADGEYWFTGLAPGGYTATETVPEDSEPSTPTSHDLGQLISGQVVFAPDFGNYIPVEVHGFKFDDLNGNGQFDMGEPGLAGVTITLSGIDGMGGNVNQTVVTDEDGEYWFTDLKPGNYDVAETVPEDTEPSTVTNHNLGDLESGDVVFVDDFGNYFPVEIHGYKFDDLNGNGIDDGEPGVPGVTITLTGVNGIGQPVSQSMQTDADGNYWFTGLRPGTYDVSETVPMGAVASTATTINVGTLESGDEVFGVSFGNYIPVEIHGFKFDDLNGNGVHDMGEPGVPGVTVTVTGVDGMGNAVNVSTTTDLDGDYWVTDLAPGTYSVTETVPAGSIASTPTTHNLGALTSGQVVIAPDFGNYIPIEVHGLKFEDLNGNGVRDMGEPGVPGVTISLSGALPNAAAFQGSTTTNADGEYWFTGLAPGGYTASETVPMGWVASTPTSHDLGQLTSGQIVIAPDFGNYIPVEVHGSKFEDVNGNGQRDDGEPDLSNVVITLSGTDGMGNNVNQTAMTDDNGDYWFTGLKPGNYDVSETVPDGSVATTPTTIMLGDLESGVIVLGADFGNFFHASIHGYKFNDLNNNGVDDGEPRISGVDITLDDGINPPVTVQTDDNGNYWFSNLGPGTVTITETPPAGTVQTTPNPGPITPTSGQVVTELDDAGLAFGNFTLDCVTCTATMAHLDFGTATSDVEAGFMRVDPSNVYAPGAAFGWEAGMPIEARDRNQPDDLRQDYNIYRGLPTDTTAPATFFVDLAPGTYDITVEVGSVANARDFSFSAEGGPSTHVSLARGAFGTFNQTVDVADGLLNLEFVRGISAAAINGLWIAPTPPPLPPISAPSTGGDNLFGSEEEVSHLLNGV